jgi:photosystem II stability/assembly factor-like uncharacterized protein
MAVILCLYLFLSACTQETPLVAPIKKIEPVDTLSMNGWQKVSLNSNLTDFAFDSQGNMYFINSGKLFFADEKFVIKDTIPVPLKGGLLSWSLSPYKIFINENDILFLAESNGFNNDLFISNDKGKTWISPNGYQETQINNFSSKGNRVYISSSGGDESSAMVQISEDNGKTWRTIVSSGTMTYYEYCQENEFNDIFFTGRGSLYFSTDYGFTITKKTLAYTGINSIAFGFNKDVVIGNDNGIFLTSDNGITWRSIYNNPVIGEFFTLFNGPDRSIYAIHSLNDNPGNSGIKDISVSKDGGYSWNSILGKLDNYYYGTYHIGKDGYLYIVSTINYVGSLYRSSVKL